MKHSILLSDVCLKIQSNCPAIDSYIERNWNGAFRSMIKTRLTRLITVSATDMLLITFDGETVWHEPIDDECASAFELALYRRLLMDHAERFGVFHAAAVSTPDATWVLCGPSGAGKSSLALEAVRRRYRCLTDEFVITDGNTVWGWPRALRFDPPVDCGALPSWLEDLECDGEQGSRYARLRDEHVGCAEVNAEQVHFVRIERGRSTRLEAVAPTEGLRHWSEAAFFQPPVSIGKLVGIGRTWRAIWRVPSELIDLLERVPLVSSGAEASA